MTRPAYTLNTSCTDTVGIVAAVTSFSSVRWHAEHRGFENSRRTVLLKH